MKENIRLHEGHEGIVFYYDSTLPKMLSRHTHPQLELNIVLSGTATYMLTGRQYNLQKGSLVWLFPEHPHIITERSKNYSMYVIVFSQKLIGNYINDLRYKILGMKEPEGYYCRLLSKNKLDLLSSVCRTLINDDIISDTKERIMTWAGEAYGGKENKTFEHSNVQKLNAGLRYLLLESWDSYNNAGENSFSTIHPAVENIVIALNDERNYPDILEYDLNQLAALAKISPSRLSRLFSKQIGIPLINYRNRNRLEYFIQLFQSKNITISEAAYNAGFGSYAQFQKCFIKEYGYSPKIVKDRMKE